MKRLLALTLAAAMVLVSLPAPLAAAGKPQGNGQIGGTARGTDQQPLRGYTVRVRNVGSGQLAATQQTNSAGEFLFTGLNPGNYVVEIVDPTGRIIATSAQLSLTAGAMTISGVAITATAAGELAAAGAAGGLGAFFTSTAGIVLIAGVGAGITAYAVTRDNGSPSK
jgi:hypothetical protein